MRRNGLSTPEYHCCGAGTGGSSGLNEVVKYAIRTTSIFLIGILVLLTVEFMILRVLPGDPSLLALPRIPGYPIDQDVMNEIQGVFDEPLPSQYVQFIGDMLSGEFYYSYQFNTDVSDFIYDYMWRTIPLLVVSLAISISLGILYGYWASRRKNHVLRQLVSLLPLALMSAFILAVAWISVHLFVVGTNWFPPAGYPLPIIQDDSVVVDLLGDNQFAYSILPTLIVCFVSVGAYALIVRDGFLLGRPLNAPVSDRPTYETDGLFISLPNLQLFVAVQMCCLIVVDIFLTYRGLGWLLIQSLMHMDYFVIQASFFVIAILVLLANIVLYVVVTALRPNRGLDLFHQRRSAHVMASKPVEGIEVGGGRTDVPPSMLKAARSIAKDYLRSPVGLVALALFVAIAGIAIVGTQQGSVFDMTRMPVPYDPTALFFVGAIAPMKLVLIGGAVALVLGGFIGLAFGLTSRYTLVLLQGLYLGVVSIPLFCLIAIYSLGDFATRGLEYEFPYYGNIFRLSFVVSLPVAVLVGHGLVISGRNQLPSVTGSGGQGAFLRLAASAAPFGLAGLKYGLVAALSAMFISDFVGITRWDSWGRGVEISFDSHLMMTTGGWEYVLPAFIGISLLLASVFLILDTLENVVRRRYLTMRDRP